MKKTPKINNDTMLQRNPNQLFTLVDDEVVMLIIEHEEYLNLNSHASFIWQQLEHPITLKELVDQLCNAYNVERVICNEDTQRFIEDFVEKNIIHILHEKST